MSSSVMRSRCFLKPEVLRFWAVRSRYLLVWLVLVLIEAGGVWGMSDAEMKALR